MTPSGWAGRARSAATGLPGKVSRRVTRRLGRRWTTAAALALLPTYLSEARAVVAGHRRYIAAEHDGQQVHELRRRIHMLEKGLVMRPRRGTFAAGYVGVTVKTVAALRRDAQEALSQEEWDWVISVLDDYFAATATSEDPRVRRAHDAYRALELEGVAAEHRGPHPPAPSDAMHFDAFAALARARSSVRWFLPKPVERDLIDRAVAVAAEAPSACNRQPYQLRVLDDPELVRRVAEIPMGTRGFGQGIPVLTAVVGTTSAFIHERDRHLPYIDSSLAAMSYVLALEAQGLSTCCINWPEVPERHATIAQALGLGDDERVIMLVAVGYADPTGLAPYSQKRHVDDIRRYN